MNREIIREIQNRGGFYEFDYSNPQDAAVVLQSLGGEQNLKENYPLVYEAFLASVKKDGRRDGKEEQKVGVSINTLSPDLTSQGLKVKATTAGLFADPQYSVEDVLKGKTPRPWLTGNLFATIYNVKAPAECPYNGSFYFQKTDNFQFEYETDVVSEDLAKQCATTILVHAVDPDNNLRTFSDAHPALGTAIDVVDTFSVSDPGSAFGNNPIIMLYGRTRSQNEGYINADYYNSGAGGEYFDNQPVGKILKTIMPLKLKIKLVRGCTFPEKILHEPCPTDPPPLNTLVRSMVKVGGTMVASMYADQDDAAAYKTLASCITTDTSGANPTILIDITRDGGHDWHSDIDGVGDWTNKVLTYFLNCGIMLDVIDPNGNPYTWQVSVTSKSIEDMWGKQYYVSNSSQVYIPPIIVHWGCFAEDTLVRLATGEDKRIDRLKKGDQVVTSKGNVVTFLESVTGADKTIFTIKTESGQIRLTGGHPVLMECGMVKTAGEIVPGDRILTVNGECQVLENSQGSYEGLVYNPVFEESREDGVFIQANGFYCGDYYAQNKQPEKTEYQLTAKQKDLVAQFKVLNEKIAADNQIEH